jgi:hypothetical protein
MTTWGVRTKGGESRISWLVVCGDGLVWSAALFRRFCFWVSGQGTGRESSRGSGRTMRKKKNADRPGLCGGGTPATPATRAGAWPYWGASATPSFHCTCAGARGSLATGRGDKEVTFLSRPVPSCLAAPSRRPDGKRALLLDPDTAPPSATDRKKQKRRKSAALQTKQGRCDADIRPFASILLNALINSAVAGQVGAAALARPRLCWCWHFQRWVTSLVAGMLLFRPRKSSS